MSVSNESRPDADSSWLRREEVLDRFETAWQEQGRASIRDFLPASGDPGRATILLELIKIDLEYRWSASEQPRVEDYLIEFPELGSVAHCLIELVREELHVRRYHGCEPTPEELAARFPSRVREIENSRSCFSMTPAEVRTAGDATNDMLKHNPSEDGSSNVRSGVTVPQRLGRYELRGLLGRGSFSSVYRAWDPQLRRDVAIKVTRPELMTGSGSRGRVLREAQSAARLRHPGIVPIHEVGQDGEHTFIVYEYVPGPTLAAVLADTTLAPRQAAIVVAQLAEALDYAHSCGIIHRDVKPANILLAMNSTEGNEGNEGFLNNARAVGPRLSPVGSSLASFRSVQTLVPRITDFGLARQTDAVATLTQQGDVLGTPAYMSPEQARGDCHRVDARTDVYSLGVLLFEILAGQLPFRGSGASILHRVIHDEPRPPSQIRTGVPGDLETICLKAMAKEPSRRYRTAGAMADDLRRFLDHRPILARRVGVAGRIALWCRRRPAIATTIAIATVVTIAAAGTSYWRVIRERDRAELLSANLAFDRALNYCEQGEVGIGVLWLARSLELAPADAANLQSAIRANLAAWRDELTVPIATLKQAEQVDELAFSDDGSHVIARSHGGGSRIWEISVPVMAESSFSELTDAAVKNEIARRLPQAVGITAAAISRDGERAITGGRDNTAHLWDMTTGSAIGSPLQHRGTVQSVAFSRDRRTVLTGSLDRTARIWNAATGEPLSPPIRHIGRVMAVAISPDGRQIVTGCHDGTIWLWAVGGRQASLVLEHENRVWSAAFTPDGEGLLTASGNMGTSGTAQLWNAASGERIGSALPHDSMVREIAISADGRTIMTGSWTPDSTVRIWNAATQEPIGPPIRFGSGGVTAVALDPRGRAAATACMGESFAQVWDLAIPSSHAISFPGRDLLAARFQLKHDSPVRSIAFSRDGRLILTGSYDGIARQWDAATGQSIGEPLRHRGQVGTVAFSRDSKFILTGTDEGHAQLWHADSGRSAGPPLRHDGTVRGVAFSPDGQWLATASWDKTARVWHAATCKPVGPALRHASEVESVTFSPDGRSVVTASWDQTARFWPMIRPIYASLNEVVVWVETITGMKLDTNEAAEVLDARAWERRHNHVRSTSVSATAGSLP